LLKDQSTSDDIAQFEQQFVDFKYAKKLQHALFKVASLSHEQMELKKLYRKVHLILDEIYDAKNFFIALYNEEEQTLLLPYFVDEKDFDDKDMTGKTLHIGNGLSSYVIKTRKPQLLTPKKIDILIKYNKIDKILGSSDFSCWMGAPMMTADKLHGVIVIQSYQENVIYNEEDLLLLDFVASHVAIAIEMNLQETQRRASDKKLAEQHSMLEQQNLVLIQTIKELETAQEELVQKEKMASLGGLVAGIAHEINTPLGVCVTAVSHLKEEHKQLKILLEEKKLTEKGLVRYIKEFDLGLQILTNNTKRGADLVRSFKQVAVDQSSDKSRTINIKEYISEVLLSLKPSLKRFHHDIFIDCPDDIFIKINAGAISQIFNNLIMNSVIHGFEGIEIGHIKIKISCKDSCMTIHYSDDGHGIDEESIKRLFEPFYTTKRGEGGSGLGTHLIFNLVHTSLQGKIEVKSKLNEGLTYIIKVPV